MPSAIANGAHSPWTYSTDGSFDGCMSPFPAHDNVNNIMYFAWNRTEKSSGDSGYLSEYDYDYLQDATQTCYEQDKTIPSPLQNAIQFTPVRYQEGAQYLNGSHNHSSLISPTISHGNLYCERSRSTPKSTGYKRKMTEMVDEQNDDILDRTSKRPKCDGYDNFPENETTQVRTQSTVATKPPKSYLEIITEALLASRDQKLILADIYQYFLDKYRFFHTTTCAWRNSIRYCLSANECFVKNGRAPKNRGFYWSIHPACVDDFVRGDFNRRKARKRVQQINQKLKSHIKTVKNISATDLLFVQTNTQQTSSRTTKENYADYSSDLWYSYCNKNDQNQDAKRQVVFC